MEKGKLFLTPPQIATRWGTNSEKVNHFLNTGQLIGCNFAKDLNGRPRWRVSLIELEIFESKRSNQKPIPPQKRRRKKAVSGKEYF
jgi:hypothetical protein